MQNIKIGNLHISDDNVRKDRADVLVTTMAGSLKEFGQMVPLIVKPAAKKDHFEIVDGGCRYMAAKLLRQSNRKLFSTLLCHITDQDGGIVSAVTNLARADMTKVDQMVAVASLIQEGRDFAAVAKIMGIEESQVRRCSKLASLDPDLLALVRKREIGLDAAKLLTRGNTHEQQREILDNAGSYETHAIREYLEKQTCRADDPLVKMIDMDDYKKRGGQIMSDLFGYNGEAELYLTDRDLVDQMVAEKTEALEAGLLKEGWGEVIWLKHAYDRYDYERVMIEVDEEKTSPLIKEREEIHAAMEALELDDEVDSDKWDALEARDKEIDEQFEALNTPAPSAELKVLICVGYSDVDIYRGYTDKSVSTTGIKAKKPDYSDALCADLDLARRRVLLAELLAQPEKALAVTAFQMVKLVKSAFMLTFWEDMPLNLSAKSSGGLFKDAHDGALTPSGKTIEEALNDYFELSDDQLLTKLCQMDQVALAQIIAVCTAASLNSAGLPKGVQRAQYLDRIERALKVDMAESWQVDDGVLSRLSKTKIEAIMSENKLGIALTGKKSEVVQRALPALQMIKWLPEPMVLPEVEEDTPAIAAE